MPGSDLDATDGLGIVGPEKRGGLRKVAILTLILLLGVVLFVEVASRVSDGVVLRRKSAPGYDASRHKRDVFDALALETLDPAKQKFRNARTEAHPYLGYALKPSFKTDPDDAQQCSHNSLGFRGKETTWEKPRGVFRIVTSGGSSVYGQSESCDAAVWSQRLEDHLKEKGYAVEVINGGCSGYSIFENLINFATRLADFHPDLLIHYEAINDMRCALYTRGGDVQHDNTHWRIAWPVDRPSMLERWVESSRTFLLWRCYATNYNALRSDLGFFAVRNYEQGGDPFDPNPVPDLGFQTYERNLRELISLATRNGTKTLLVTQPLARYHLEPAPSIAKQLAGIDRIQDIERRVGHEENVPVFELARIIEPMVQKELDAEVEHQRALDPKAAPEELLQRAKATLHPVPLPKPNQQMPNVIFHHDVHPYDYGSDLIARTMADYLVGSGLLPAKGK
jgi:hypothetical protein